MTSVSAGHIIQTPTQPVGSGRPQRESNPVPPHQESRALPQSYRAPLFSRQLRNAELKYSAFDRELLGVHLAIRHFGFMLEGRQFSVYTDHKPLVHAMAKTAELWSSRLQRHLSAISEFTTDIRHVSGKNNTVADCLSRATTANTVSLCIDYTDMARAHLPASMYKPTKQL